MTPQQINAAIAEDLGWTQVPAEFDGYTMVRDSYWQHSGGGRSRGFNYFHSLDAIRAAALERFKTTEERLNFSFHLSLLCRGGKQLWELTAAEESQAYLRAVGKWKEAA